MSIYNDHPASIIAFAPVTLLLFAKQRTCSATSSTVAKRFNFVLAREASSFSWGNLRPHSWLLVSCMFR